MAVADETSRGPRDKSTLGILTFRLRDLVIARRLDNGVELELELGEGSDTFHCVGGDGEGDGGRQPDVFGPRSPMSLSVGGGCTDTERGVRWDGVRNPLLSSRCGIGEDTSRFRLSGGAARGTSEAGSESAMSPESSAKISDFDEPGRDRVGVAFGDVLRPVLVAGAVMACAMLKSVGLWTSVKV